MPNALTTFMHGCGPFWIANSITSTYLGATNRDLQHKIAVENEQFQLKMEELRNESQEKIEEERISFRRHIMSITREFQRQERVQIAQNMDKQIEVSFFASQWPLDLPVTTILEQIKHKHHSLNVILLRNPILASERGMQQHREAYITKQEMQLYDDLEWQIVQDMPFIGDVYFRQDACKKGRNRHIDDIITSADIMNIHFLMGSIPTLVILPKYQEGKLYLTAAIWDEQASRPLILSLFAMQHDPSLAYIDEKYRVEMIEKFHYTISIIIGALRDQYAVVTWGKQPTLSSMLSKNEQIKRFMLDNLAIKDFVVKEYRNTLKTLASNKRTDLLQVYEPTEINRMITLIAQEENLLNIK